MALAASGHAMDMWTSIAYHTYNAMGRKLNAKLLTVDLSGIIFVMLTSFNVLIYHLFSEHLWERKLIMGAINPLIVCNLFVLFHPRCAKDSMECTKVIVIAATNVLTFSTFIAGGLYYSSDYQYEEIYPRLFKSMVFIILGFGFWLSHYPERLHFLGKYQIVQYYFNSHVFWHCLTLVGHYVIFWTCYELNMKREAEEAGAGIGAL